MTESTSESSIDVQCRNILDELYNPKPSLTFQRISELLSEFRVLTRDKTISPEILDKRCMETLVKLSRESHIEAQKCLSNLILNYPHLRDVLIEPYVTCMERRLYDILKEPTEEDRNKSQHCEVLYYDLRIVFLLSALCSTARPSIRDRVLDLLLRVTLREADYFRQQNYLLVIESLKTLFNLTMDKCSDTRLASKVIKKLLAIVGTEHFEQVEAQTEEELDHTDKLLVNIIHLLTNMPEEVYMQLSDEDVDKILDHLDEQLKSFSRESFRDTVLPVLNTCANICRYKESVRKRWFDKIIGSTKEFDKRPEEYDTLRGRLVKLMTSVDVHIKEIAAEFLYALCGDDTEKFITYTGFGNSAAFLSTKGLLSHNNKQSANAGESSNRSEDEYQELRSKLNPITGKIEQPRKDPMDGMTEEEKEWHAQELADAIEKLSNLGVFKPMQLSLDGETREFPSRLDGPRSEDSRDLRPY